MLYIGEIMKRNFKNLMRRQIQQSIDKYSSLSHVQSPMGGWLKNIREALDMPQDVFAQKLHCSKTNAINLETREMLGNITLNKLSEAAEALDCKLVYVLVPIKPLDQLRKDQAIRVAKNKLEEINHSMALEDQALTEKQLTEEETDLVEDLLDSGKKLWSSK